MTVAIRRVTVPREFGSVYQGQTVLIVVTIADVDVVSILLDPSSVPVISIFDPLDTALVVDQPMVYLSQGVYTCAFPTTASHPVGVYVANITVVDVSGVARLEKTVVFKIIKATSLASFSYLAIKDQNSVVWYWYIAADNTLAFSPTVPAIAGKQAVALLSATVPSWLEISNPALRYVSPTLSGESQVSATQPVVGIGQVGSPTFLGISQGQFVISLNISDEVILNIV